MRLNRYARFQNAVRRWLALASCVPLALTAAPSPAAEDGYYTEEHVYGSRPDPDREMHFGHIGVTGLKVRIYPGVVMKVEGVAPQTPAEGKFTPGQILTGINGVAFKGKNPFVAAGQALTAAEATDGSLVFDVQDRPDAPVRQVRVVIPVLGAYSSTWPLNCDKSRRIIQRAAEYYAKCNAFKEGNSEDAGIDNALTCLFLLSTGDDQYLPCVKAYFAQFLPDVKRIGENTWNNGYNGIACAEYFLRTGDTRVLPILQYYCDDARLRQKFGCGWGHWGNSISPGYVAGGLMNPAGAQELTTLLLGKECGVAVDDRTLLGALRFWYRFTGHGTVPYGDHRPEGGLGSNGKDGMSAAAMQIASGARGAAAIYRQSRDYLALSMLDSYPVLVQGHADEGRGDGIWRGIASAYVRDVKPEAYHAAMRRLEWWYDLSRRPSGGLGMSMCQRTEFDAEGSGAGVALAYTAPLKTLRITGARRSKYAKAFTLPRHLWGTKADEAFLSAENLPEYARYGAPDPAHVPFWKFGGAYHRPEGDLKDVPREEMLKNVYHVNYMIRAQSAKALRAVGALDELEKLLRHPDPRVRRAALDGIVDYNYWFGMGGQHIPAGQLTPAMREAINAMLADPKEALWVADGALMAMSLAKPAEISASRPLILPWTKHEDWWLRESAFVALLGMEKDEALLQECLPTLISMMVSEYHTFPRQRFNNALKDLMQKKQAAGPIGGALLDGFLLAVNESQIKPGAVAGEGAYNVTLAADACLGQSPETTLQAARAMVKRFSQLETGQIIGLVAAPNANREGRPRGLYTALAELPTGRRQELADVLCNEYRPELVRRMKAGEANDQALLDTILDITRLKNPAVGWKAIGTPAPAERIWRYTAFEPQPADAMPRREKKRFRDVALPPGCEKWSEPGFDDCRWKSGNAPIGIGVFTQRNVSYTNRSDWGEGEFLLARTTFEMGEPDYDFYRISVLARQGFHIYLNGHKIHTYIWWKDMPHYRLILLGPDESRFLARGTNTLAVYCNVEYEKQAAPQGQIDVYLEGLKKKDLEEQ